MRKASLGTIFLTVFLDLLGFGIVIPFLPGVARSLGASAFVATAAASIFSAMQFLFIPLWGRLSDRVGRRPVLLWSIAASSVGMLLLGYAPSLATLFLARAFSGIATANIAVAQAYIADVTTPETRARGMGIIGMGFGLGFVFGPALGGLFSHVKGVGHEGSVSAYVAAGLSAINFVFALIFLPESHPKENRGKGNTLQRRSPFDFKALRKVASFPGLGVAMAITFSVTFWFSGMEATFRLFTQDAFDMTVAGTGFVFVFVGVVAIIVQGGLIHRLSRRFGEVNLIRTGLLLLAAGFLIDGLSARLGLGTLLLGSAAIATGNSLYTPSLSSYSSRQTGIEAQGLTLGVVQSMGALARVFGPLVGGLIYQFIGMRAPYFLGALGVLGVAALAFQLPQLSRRQGDEPRAAAAH